MIFNVRVDIDLGAFQQQVISNAMSSISQAVGMTAEHAKLKWIDNIVKAKLRLSEKNIYADSITWHMEGPLSAIVESDYKLAMEIEKGRPSWDMHIFLQTSHKTRINKKGRRYLIIPLRHNTTGNTAHARTMPPEIQVMAKKLSKSSILSMTTRISGSGHVVPQAKYNWAKTNGRLRSGLGIYSHMVRMETSSGKSKSSAYLTFRTMSEGSPGWIYPEQPAQSIIKEAAIDAQKVLDDSIFHILSG